MIVSGTSAHKTIGRIDLATSEALPSVAVSGQMVHKACVTPNGLLYDHFSHIFTFR